MGWRERDYAKFTDQEFAAIYGGSRRSGPPPPAQPPANTGSSGAAPLPHRRRRSGRSHRPAGRLAAIVTLAVAGAATFFTFLVATGNVENFNNFISKSTSPHTAPVAAPDPIPVIKMPPAEAPRLAPTGDRQVGLIAGTRLLHAGMTLRLTGTHTPDPGSIVIRGRWNANRRWVTFGVARGSVRSYALAVPLTRRGVLHLRIDYPGGYRAVGTYQVQ